jgi:uncharacterized membrane protein
MDLSNQHKDFFEVNTESDSNVGQNNAVPELPDYHKADSLAHVDLLSKYDLVKQISINNPKKESTPMTLLKPIGYLVALIAGFVFAILFPGVGFEAATIGIVTTVAGMVGLTDWRKNFDNFEGFFKSKTLVGALLALIPVVAFTIITVFGIKVPEYVTTLMNWLLTAGGGTSLLGIINANQKAQ